MDTPTAGGDAHSLIPYYLRRRTDVKILVYYKIRRWKKMGSFPVLSRNKETVFNSRLCELRIDYLIEDG